MFINDYQKDVYMHIIEGRYESKRGRSTLEGHVITWDKEELLDFTGWTEANYKKRTLAERTTQLEAKGVILTSTEGRGDDILFHVTITNACWYFLLLREEMKINAISVDYLNNLLGIGLGMMDIGGALIIPTQKEMATIFAQKHGETVKSASLKIDRVRTVLKKYEYVIAAKHSSNKQYRVKESGSEEYAVGPDAHLYHELIAPEYLSFYKQLDAEHLGYNAKDSKDVMALKRIIRREKSQEFTAKLCKRHNLRHIRKHRVSVASEQATTDYKAIIVLYLSGATFTEIRQFLAERPQFWMEQTDSYDIETIL